MKNKDLLKQILKENLVSWLVILGLIFLCFYFYFDILKKAKDIDLIKKDLYSKEMSALRAQVLEEEWKKAESYYQKLREILPEEKELVKLEEKIKNFKTQFNIDLDFRFGSLNTISNEPKSYNYSLTILGEKETVLKVLEAFRKISPAIRLEQIELRQISSQDKKEMIEIKILGRVYIK